MLDSDIHSIEISPLENGIKVRCSTHSGPPHMKEWAFTTPRQVLAHVKALMTPKGEPAVPESHQAPAPGQAEG